MRFSIIGVIPADNPYIFRITLHNPYQIRYDLQGGNGSMLQGLCDRCPRAGFGAATFGILAYIGLCGDYGEIAPIVENQMNKKM